MKRIIIVGKAASGKDYLKSKFIEKGFINAISYTTRPIRENELNGKDYLFIAEEEFKSKINNNFFYEYNQFNNWYYGIPRHLFLNEGAVFIMNPSGIYKLNKSDRESSFIIYLDIDKNIRKE